MIGMQSIGRTAVRMVMLFAVGGIGVLGARSLASAQEVRSMLPAERYVEDVTIPIACPADMEANGGPLLNLVYVAQAAGGDEIPFVPYHYEYKRGNAASGLAWYWPTPRTAMYAGMSYEWVAAGVLWKCLRRSIGDMWLDLYLRQGYEGIAVPSDPSLGGGGSGDGDGSGGGAPSTDPGLCVEFRFEADDGSVSFHTYCSDQPT